MRCIVEQQLYLHKMLNHFRKGLAMLSRRKSLGEQIFRSQLMLFIEYLEEDEKDLLLLLKEKGGSKHVKAN